MLFKKNIKMINENNADNNIINNSYPEDLIIDKREYILIKNNLKFYILIIKLKINILIKCTNYQINLNLINFSKLFNINFDSLDDIFNYINNSFNEGKIIIKEIVKYKFIKLLLKDKIENEIDLIYNLIPNNLIFLNNITKDSFCSSPIENTFTIFNSINNILYLVYATKDKSIKSINIIENQLINEIKNAHTKFITNFKHYYHSIKKIDIIMSISSDDNEIKIWNVLNWNCLLHLKKINKSGNLLSACFLKDNNNILITTSNFEIFNEPDAIKLYDEKGNIIKEIMNSKENIFNMEIYFDKTNSTNYIITCNLNYVKSYNYNKNFLYHKYYEENNSFHISVVINESNNIIKLIELCNDGNIRIWDFHSNILLKKIKVDNNGLISICLWDENNFLVGSKNRGIKLITINEGKIQKIFKIKNNIIYTIKIINHPKYGRSLITQGTFFEQIKFWII